MDEAIVFKIGDIVLIDGQQAIIRHIPSFDPCAIDNDVLWVEVESDATIVPVQSYCCKKVADVS